MSKTTKIYRCKPTPTGWVVHCPATGFITIPRDGRWTFSGDFERPTFSPSLNETTGKPEQSMAEFKADPNPDRNHVFVRNGFIEYLSDCTHEWAGKTVEIEPLSEAEVSIYFGE